MDDDDANRATVASRCARHVWTGASSAPAPTRPPARRRHSVARLTRLALSAGIQRPRHCQPRASVLRVAYRGDAVDTAD